MPDCEELKDTNNLPTSGGNLRGWQTIFFEDFEDFYWDDNWEIYTPSSVDASWGRTNWRQNGGSYSVYCAQEGFGTPSAPGPYPEEMESWLIYGGGSGSNGFDLSDADDATLSFDLWYSTDNYEDRIGVYASIDGYDYYFIQNWYGYSNGWTYQMIDLKNAGALGNLCGQSSVWIAFIFESDEDFSCEGVYIDDVNLSKNTPIQNGFIKIQGYNWDDDYHDICYW